MQTSALATPTRQLRTTRLARPPYPAIDDQLFAVDRFAATADVVLNARGIHLETRKYPPDIRVLIQAQDGLALQLTAASCAAWNDTWPTRSSSARTRSSPGQWLS